MSRMAFVKYINDPLHGPIGITEKELKVIHTRTFQRLKNIKQLGTANFVYPGANHSRFEHSIGTMHVTSLILDRLQEYTEAETQIVRLAALLHDIGHGPFSHTLEELLRRNPEYVSDFAGKKLCSHEDFSQYILKQNHELKKSLKSDIDQIVAFLFDDKSIGKIPSELVTGDIGSDRIDYLIRDTYYTGLGHRPDVNSLISHMRISIKEKEHPRLALEAEGILSAEFLITTRYYHYSMIVHNIKTRSVEFLFLRLMENFLRSQSNPTQYLFDAFTKYDDSVILGDLFKFSGSLKDLFYSGRSFHPVYNINMRQLRSGVTKYCIYRFFFDQKGLMEYIRQVGKKLRKTIDFDSIIFDVHLFNHNTPDIIFYADAYETEKEWISPFLVDQSSILRLIPLEQLLRSSVCVMNERDLSKGKTKELYQKIEKNRGIFLVREVLVPLARKSMTKNGFQLLDEFYTFLCALRAFYNEKPWKDNSSNVAKEEMFRGISRLYELASECYKEIGRPRLAFKEFFKGETESFQYSTQGFSILNALASLGILHLDYIPVEKSDDRPFHFAYVIRPVERDIKKRVYDGLAVFNELIAQYLGVFKKLDWDKYFAEFFPLKAKGE